MISGTSNKPATPNAGIAPRLTIGHHWPGVGEPGRSTSAANVKATLTLLVAATCVISGCCTHRDVTARNNLQDYGAYIYDIRLTMANLQLLDAGDVQMTRLHSLARVSLALHGLSCLNVPKEAWQIEEEKQLAQDVLAYMVLHRQDINTNAPPLLRDGIQALGEILTDEVEERQLNELTTALGNRKL
jgi:hypothetical protein